MKIIIVEDEKSIRNGLTKMLPKLSPDYEVMGAAKDGLEGYHRILDENPDLVIMDIQMPEMDGLTMLEKLREKGFQGKAVVLTAYSDFSYAKRAIELGIENYLLKPIKIDELKKTLEAVNLSLRQEAGTRKMQEKLLSLEQIFRSALLAELTVDEELESYAESMYGLNSHGTFAVLMAYLSDYYDEYYGPAERFLEPYLSAGTEYSVCMLTTVRYRAIVMVFYNIRDPEKIRNWYEKRVIPAAYRSLEHAPIFCWTVCEGLTSLSSGFEKLEQARMWKLCFPEGSLMTEEQIRATKTVPIKYSPDLESQLKQAVVKRDKVAYDRILEQLIAYCVEEPHHPDEIREAWARLVVAMVTVSNSMGRVTDNISMRHTMEGLSQAISWQRIRQLMQHFYDEITGVHDQPEHVSLLVKKALSLIETYYSQGITLEELAERLCVTDEYLSTLIKKETGMSFTETLRKVRIERMKELLLHSGLKLNQIAEMVGYSDPKYMSKVFKEEVGMLPAQFRKQNH
ncbi:response regulator [Clostridium sp. AF32-12BH]|uniref:response regulator n=1 Tax=Clostridium sp. AF32-12BH TaxID=2292006 RepID=UPI0015FCC095|nr:response regulator [Clostridium sp. AF32-12BH]